MHLREYLAKKNERPYRFAKRAKVRPATIYALIKDGKLNLTQETMQKIILASGGGVSFEDLM